MLDMTEIGSHVQDDTAFHIPIALWNMLPESMHGAHPHPGSVPLPNVNLLGYDLQITKFMVLEVVAAVLMILIFVPLARRISTGKPLKGRFGNFFETLIVFIRDEVARPSIGKHDADRFLPFVWTMFFFVLFCNLLGMVPWAGSATGNISVTAVLALATFLVVIGAGMKRFGPVGFWVGQVPSMDLPLAIAVVLKPGLFFIEVIGLLIKHVVLAVRLLANMFAGHLVLAVIVGFIGAVAGKGLLLFVGVTAASVLGAVALSLLELFVAFLQAYIFAFLTSLFIGMAVHQH